MIAVLPPADFVNVMLRSVLSVELKQGGSVTTYPDLPNLIGQLKLAAIDAFMREEFYGPNDDGTMYMKSDQHAGGYRYGRPDKDGRGGTLCGAGVSVPGGGHADTFDEIRLRIDEILAPWTDLPRPIFANKQRF